MKVKAPVKLSLNSEQLLAALRAAGYDIPSSGINIEVLNTNGYMYSIPLGSDKIVVGINWNLEVEVGGPHKCTKDSNR